MPQHPPAVGDLGVREAAAGAATGGRPYITVVERRTRHPAASHLRQERGTSPVALGAKALKAERMVAVSANAPAEAEQRFAVAAGLAEATDGPRFVSGVRRHPDPPRQGSDRGVTGE